jgi:hypothetical protein
LALAVVLVNSDVQFNPTSIYYLALMAICNAVYLTQYSKEFFQLPLVLVLIYLVGRKRQSPLWIALAICIYAYFFRAYWALTASMFLFLAFVQSRTKSKWVSKVFLSTIVVLAFLPFASSLIGFDVANIRENLNIGRFGENFAVTAISTPLPSNNLFIAGLSQIILAVELMVPFPLFASGDLQYFLIGAGISSIWVVFLLRGLKHENANPKSQIVLLMVAFLVTNSLFEPDFGSLLRHMTVLFPLMLLSTWNVSNEINHFGLATKSEHEA